LYTVAPAQVTTQQGECQITVKLEINLNINSNGDLSVSATGKPVVTPKEITPYIEQEDDKVDWAIPDFNNERIQFGKQVKEE
jgi:hypothetical protein